MCPRVLSNCFRSKLTRYCFECLRPERRNFFSTVFFISAHFSTNTFFFCFCYLISGSDLLTSLTSTFDRKWKSLVNPTNLLMTSTDSTSTSASDNERREEIHRSLDREDTTRPAEVYRDPSLHKSPADNARMIRTLNVSFSFSKLR